MPESKANRGPTEVSKSPELETRHHMRTSNERLDRAVGTPYCNRLPGEPGTEATRRRIRQTKSSKQHQRGWLHLKSRRAQPNPRSGCRKNRSYPTLWPLLVITGGNGEAALPTERGVTAATLQRQREAGRQQQSPHPPASHAWLASRPPHTASGQRREATTSVIASGHKNGERDRRTAISHSDHPEATAATGSGNSRDWSRQTDLRGLLVIKKPPPATPKPLEWTQWNH